ncbi:MAG: asparaginase domain-containing protein [Leucobacter sp.]
MSGSTPSVLVVATGGTIGMRETERGLALDPDFPDALEAMVSAVCSRLRADYRINHLSPAIESANADAETAPRLAASVRARVRTVRPRGVVILHGTDTLAHTAARLAFELDGLGAPVVVTGSQLPHGAPGTDAGSNLELAIRVALRANPDAPVSIAFGGELVPAVRATKFQAEALQAFRSERPLAAGAVGAAKAGIPQQSPEPRSARVISFRFVPAVTADDLRAAVGGRPDGLVLECYGAGNAPTGRAGMLDALREVCATVPVVAVTQCATGRLDFARYAVARDLAQAGVMPGGDMTLESAVAKLGYALDRGMRDAELRAVMGLNLVGERG